MKRKIFYGTLIVMIIILVVIGTYIYNLFTSFEQGVSDSFEATDRDRSELRLDDIDPTMDSFTVLILGIDESATRKEQEKLETEDFRTDTMILATFDKEQDEVKLTSIPRDTLTYFPEENYFDKITHAHREGGPEASMRAVESLLNVPVDHYVRANMTAVVDIVDALGGVEFDVPFDMEEPNQTDRGEEIVLEEGEQVLNGEEALAVVRSRSVDTDLGRGQRQLKLVEKILSKAKSTGALSKVDDLIEVVADNTKHDMESKTIRSLAAYYSFNDIDFNTTQVRGDDFWNPGNGAYFYWANEEHLYVLSKTLRDVLKLDEPDPYDLINIRLSDHIVPYQFVDDYYLNEFEPEGEPFFMQEGYESRFGNGFNIQEDNPEDSIEGEENPEETTSEEGTGEQPMQEEATGEMPREPTTEEDNYWPPEDGNGSEGIQEESTEQFNYEEDTEEYYEENTGEYYDNGTGSADWDRAQNEY
ncbi:LCP family protein [Salinicoccus roseus]|uniref:LCP family protein n=1 Tax=Salinicoccus roseus TaxID=45670 RepID=UPI003DA132EC